MERKEENDDTIEVVLFETPASIEGKKVERSHSPTVQLTESTLRIRNAEETHLVYAAFKIEFPFSQATEEEGFFERNVIALGSTFLYLRVPEDLTLRMYPHVVTEVSDM